MPDDLASADERRRILVRRIRYTEFHRPLTRGAVAGVLLLPVLYRGLVEVADRLLVAGLGVVSAGSLVYAAWKFREMQSGPGTAGRPANGLMLASLPFVVVGGVTSVLAAWTGQEWTVWVAAVALALAPR